MWHDMYMSALIMLIRLHLQSRQKLEAGIGWKHLWNVAELYCCSKAAMSLQSKGLRFGRAVSACMNDAMQLVRARVDM